MLQIIPNGEHIQWEHILSNPLIVAPFKTDMAF